MEEKAAGAERLRIIRAQFQRRVIGGDGFLEPALLPECETLVIEAVAAASASGLMRALSNLVSVSNRPERRVAMVRSADANFSGEAFTSLTMREEAGFARGIDTSDAAGQDRSADREVRC